MPRLNPFAWGRTKLTKVWEAAIEGHVISLAWSAPLGLIAAASVDGPMALFDAATGQIRHALAGHNFGTSCVAWSADGQHLASCGQDGKVKWWDSATGQMLREVVAGAAWAERIAWSPLTPDSSPPRGEGGNLLPSPLGGEGSGVRGPLLASAAGKKLRLWSEDGTLIREYADQSSTIADIQWKPNEAILASAGYGKLFLWSPEQQEPVREFQWQGSMLALAWSPDGKYIAAGAQDSSVHFWRMADGEDLQMSGYPTKVRELAWDESSRYLATGGGPMPCVWDTSGDGPAGTQPLQFEAHKDNVTCLAFQPQGAYLASGGEDGLVALWQPGKQLGALALAKHASPISQLLWAADSLQLAVGTAEGNVIVYSIQ
jgi:WD40 repeat protein